VKVLLVLAACVFTGSVATPAKELITLRVSPHFSMAPATIRVVVTVEPDSENRELQVAADSGQFFTSSTIQLDGSNAPRSQWIEMKELPAGDYVVEARVRQRDGAEHRAVAEYMIMGDGQ